MINPKLVSGVPDEKVKFGPFVVTLVSIVVVALDPPPVPQVLQAYPLVAVDDAVRHCPFDPGANEINDDVDVVGLERIMFFT